MRVVIGLAPENAVALNHAAWLLATGPDELRDGAQAVEFVQKAVELVPSEAPLHGTLAAAYAEAGQFENATEVQRRAIELLGDDVSPDERFEYERVLRLFEEGRPYRLDTELP